MGISIAEYNFFKGPPIIFIKYPHPRKKDPALCGKLLDLDAE